MTTSIKIIASNLITILIIKIILIRTDAVRIGSIDSKVSIELLV